MSEENQEQTDVVEPEGDPARRDRYAPGNFRELMKFAKVVIGSQLCPDHIKSPEDVVMIVQQGAELGLSPMQALQNMHAIRGKVGLGADLMKGICHSSGEVERWEYEVTDEQRCVLHVKRKGHDALPPIEWTIQDARDKGLTSSQIWQDYPRQMLRHRADAEAARTAFPDLLSGLYTPEELHSIPEDGGSSSTDEQPSPARQASSGDGRADRAGKHFTEIDYSARDDRSETDAWQSATQRFLTLCEESGFTDPDADPDTTEQLRRAIERRHNVDSWTRIPAETLDKWCELFERRPDQTGDGETPRRDLAMKVIRSTGVDEAA